MLMSGTGDVKAPSTFLWASNCTKCYAPKPVEPMDKSQQLGYITVAIHTYIHNLVLCIQPFTGDVDVALPTPNPSTNQKTKAFFIYNSSMPSMKVTGFHGKD